MHVELKGKAIAAALRRDRDLYHNTGNAHHPSGPSFGRGRQFLVVFGWPTPVGGDKEAGGPTVAANGAKPPRFRQQIPPLHGQ